MRFGQCQSTPRTWWHSKHKISCLRRFSTCFPQVLLSPRPIFPEMSYFVEVSGVILEIPAPHFPPRIIWKGLHSNCYKTTAEWPHPKPNFWTFIQRMGLASGCTRKNSHALILSWKLLPRLLAGKSCPMSRYSQTTFQNRSHSWRTYRGHGGQRSSNQKPLTLNFYLQDSVPSSVDSWPEQSTTKFRSVEYISEIFQMERTVERSVEAIEEERQSGQLTGHADLLAEDLELFLKSTEF